MDVEQPHYNTTGALGGLPVEAIQGGAGASRPQRGDWVASRKADGAILVWTRRLADLNSKVREVGEDPENVTRFRFYEDTSPFGGIELEVGESNRQEP